MPKKRTLKLFRGIEAAYTLSEVAVKEGRRILPEDLTRVPKAALLTEGGRILACAPEKELLKDRDIARQLRESRVQEEKLDGIVIPAFLECHTHLVYAGNRAAEFERRNQGESYQAIAQSGGGILATVLPTRAASEQSLAAEGQKRAERFISQGVTTIECKSGYGLTIKDEFKQLKAAGRIKRARIIRTFLGAHAVPKEFSNASEYIDHLIQSALPPLKKSGLACRVDIFVEEGYFPQALARRYLQAARAFGFDVVVHADQLTHSGGADLAVEIGARSADHLLQINKQDRAKLAASDVTCVLLPSSDLYMNCAYPPAQALIDDGARVALATDFNPGSCPSQDISLVGVLARVQMKMTLAQVLSAYTVGAAHALGLEDQLGSLTPGKCADFVVLSGDIEELFLAIGSMPIERVYREAERLI